LLGALLLAALQLAPEADGGADVAPLPGAPELHIHGNEVMADEVYLAVLDLPPDAVADLATAVNVREQLLAFLTRAGYELAQVHVTVVGHALDVDIDEGQVEKIVFRGKLSFQTLQLKLALVLPHDVFNRPQLDRELKRLSAAYHIEKVWYELIPTQHVEHIGPQLEQLPEIQGLELVHARRRYELHVFFAEHEWSTGAGLDVRSGYPDGVELGLFYQGEHLLLADDRWKVAISAGGNLRNHIPDQGFYLTPSRLFGEAKWYSPDIHGIGRPLVWLRAEGVGRQRQDLDIENYYHELFEGSLNFQWQFARGLTLSLGGGTQFRRIFGACFARPISSDFTCYHSLAQVVAALPQDQVAPPLPAEANTKITAIRSFVLLHTDLVFDPSEERWDRQHTLTAEARDYIRLTQTHYAEVRAAYRKVWSIGWHDVWLRARGAYLDGDVFFHDEEPLGRHVRGVFGTEYVQHAASLSGEFRFSITRDVFKVSFFHDVAAYGHLDRYTTVLDPVSHQPVPAARPEIPAVADSFGAGFHALVQGMIQVDIYLAFGFASHYTPIAGTALPWPHFGTGGSISVEKVF
jgi:hypothetical protein